jgi:adenylate cyclase
LRKEHDAPVAFGIGPGAVLNEIAWGIVGTLLGVTASVLVARLTRSGWQRARASRASLIRASDGSISPTDLPSSMQVKCLACRTRRFAAARAAARPAGSACSLNPRALPPPAADEHRVLQRIHAPSNVRLACQLRPRGAVNVLPLVTTPLISRDHLRRPVSADGSEREVVIMFADLHDFTRFAETRLPFDVVFILNRYFQEMGQAVELTGGHVDKFIGDA